MLRTTPGRYGVGLLRKHLLTPSSAAVQSWHWWSVKLQSLSLTQGMAQLGCGRQNELRQMGQPPAQSLSTVQELLQLAGVVQERVAAPSGAICQTGDWSEQRGQVLEPIQS